MSAPTAAHIPFEIFDALGEGSWDWDMRTNVIRHNARWCEMLGADESFREHDLDTYYEFVHPEDRETLAHKVRQAIGTGSFRRDEYRMVRLDGQVIWVVDRGAVVERDGAGWPLRMVGAIRDVTEERRGREALRDSEERLQLALRSGDLGLRDWNLETNAIVVDARWKTMLGLPAPLPVESLDVWNAHVLPEDRPKLEHIVATVFANPRGREFSVEVRARHADGHVIWILDQGIVAERGPDGRPRRVTGTHLDITQRKAAEHALEQQRRQLQTVVGSAMDAIVSLDARREVVVFNDAAQRLFGLDAAQVLGRHVGMLLPPRLRPRAPRWIRRLARGGPQRLVADTPDTCLARGDGSRFPAEVSVAASGSGDDALLTAFVRDITAARQAQAALRAKEAAEEANEAKTAFLSRVSHELRTPLNAILGFAELLEGELPAAPEARRKAQLIRTAGDRLLALVNDLLELSKIESGALRLEPRPLAVAHLLEDVRAMLEAQAAQRRITLALAPLPPGLAVRADVRALDQVLLNLVSNALKFTPTGGRVLLRAGADGAQAWIEVEDSGQGIPPQRQGELFQAFNRLGVTDPHAPGSGLGLAISRELARLMAGDLAVARSAPDEGTTMRLTLPRAQEPQPAAAEAPLPAAVDGEGAGSTPGGDVLILEDDALSALLMEQIVQMAGNWRAVSVPALAPARALLRERHFDLILADLNLGEEDGVAFIASLRDWPGRARATVVAVSADVLGGQVERARRAGADGYWMKPVTPSQLVRFLQADRRRWPALLG